MNNHNDKKILTIAIPAYGRPNTLETIIKQFQNEDVSKFNLLICDDASPNDLTDTVKKYLSQMPNLKFIRNEKNLGFSGNVCKLYDLAETDFIWFVCDDDTIIPGCVTKIVESLIKYNPTVAVYNHIWTNPYGIEGTAGVKADVIYHNENEVKDYNDIMRMTFLSTLVLKKLLTSEEIRKTEYTSNVFIQISLALILLSNKFVYAQIATPVIYRHVGYKYGEFFKFSTVDHLRSIFAINHTLDNKKFLEWARKQIPTNFKLYMSQKLGMFKYSPVPPSKRTIKEIVKYYGLASFFIFMYIPIYFLTPTFILKRIYKLFLNEYHDKETAKKIYEQNINRAFKDNRETGFTEYR